MKKDTERKKARARKEHERKTECKKEKLKEKKKRVKAFWPRKEGKKVSLFTRSKKIRKAYFFHKPMTVLMCKEACFSSNDDNSSIHSVMVEVLQDYKDLFLEDLP